MHGRLCHHFGDYADRVFFLCIFASEPPRGSRTSETKNNPNNKLMKLKAFPLFIALSATAADAALISLNTITPGTESVTLVANGDYESGASNTTPTSWTRAGASFYDTDASAGLTSSGFSNIPTTGKVAYYSPGISETTIGGSYSQAISGLEANTSYVFSAYLWNRATTANTGTNKSIVMDFNDNKPGAPIGDGVAIEEAQQVLAATQTDAAAGYFAYVPFDTGVTGTAFTIRIFSTPGTYNAAGSFMAWDNVAITKSSNFVLPVPEPSTALLGGLGLLALLRRRR